MVAFENIVDFFPVATELFTWFWNKFGDSLLKSAAKTAWQNFDHVKGAQRYAQKVEELYGTMRILGKNEPVSVTDIYTSLSILDKFTAQLRYDPERLNMELWSRKSAQENINRVAGMDVVQSIDNLFVLGRPGAGKSTFLRHVTLEALQGRVFKQIEKKERKKTDETIKTISKGRKGKGKRGSASEISYVRVEETFSVEVIRLLPILIELRDFALEETSLLEYIVKQFDVCGFPDASDFIDKVLNEGRLIVLFDGLDEIPKDQDKLQDVSKEIEDFTSKYSANKFIITCRIAASDYRFKQFTYVELADFSNSQAKEFTQKWFRHKPRYKTSFWRDLDDSGNAGLMEMTRNPLLLTLLCLNYEVTQSFPSRHVEIYEEALDALLKTWDAERGIIRTGTKLSTYGKLSLGHKKELFSELALSGFEKHQLIWKDSELSEILANYVASIPPQQDPRNIDGFQVLKDIEAQHAILVEQAKNQYSFAHLTFQEYYTANHIVTEGVATYKKLIKNHVYDSRWREVLLLSASKMPKLHADSFFKAYLQQLRIFKSKSDEAGEWIEWLQKKSQGAYKTEAESLAARNFLALCSAQFTREQLQNESTNLEYFCKLWGLSPSNSYHSLLLQSVFGKKLLKQNSDVSFDCLIYGIYRSTWQRLAALDININFIPFYNLIVSIVEEIPVLYPRQHGKYQDQLRGIIQLTREGQISSLARKLEDFLINERRWNLRWGKYDEQGTIINFLKSSMLCIECLDLARVSDRSEIYQFLFA